MAAKRVRLFQLEQKWITLGDSPSIDEVNESPTGVGGTDMRYQGASFKSPQKVASLMWAMGSAGWVKEHFWCFCLDGKHNLTGAVLVSVGTLNSSYVHPREVFGPAVHAASAAIVCAHNHPSGDPEPSAEDVQVTKRLLDSGRTLGIPLLDHVVVGGELEDGWQHGSNGLWMPRYPRLKHVSLRERIGF